MKRSRICAWITLLGGTLLAGCGGGGGGGGSAPAGLAVTNFQSSSAVIGQPTFTSFSSNATRAVAAHTNGGSYGSPLINNGILYIPDYATDRVLGFNAVPATNGASANFVLGQPDLVSSLSGTAADRFNGPESVRFTGGKLFVTDYGNSRILIWNTPPTTTGVPADVVVGKPDFTTNGCSGGAAGLCFADDMFTVGTKLIVADSINNRVLIWNTIPTSNGTAADVVLGQGNFTLTAANDDNQDGIADATPSNRTMSGPVGIWSNGTKLVVCDSSNNRVLIWNTFPTTSFTAADVVMGQGDFLHRAANDDDQNGSTDTTPTARTFSFPYYVTSNGTQLFIADSNNNRVLMWNGIPTTNFVAAARVLGQATFTANASNDDNQDGIADATPTARTLDFPNGLYLFSRTLFVSDNDNNRYLIFQF